MESRRLRDGTLVVGLALLCSATAAQETERQEPQRTDLVETTERRLVQIDVSVKGERGIISDLKREDFRLAVGFDKVPEFILDNLCVLPDDDPTQTVEVVVEQPGEAQPATPRQTLPNFLFYFDQHHLTMAGRANSIDTARELVSELIGGGNRGMIVSAGKELRAFSELTDDRDELLEALTELNGDSRQWDPWVQQEESRIGEILEILNDPSDTVTRALGLARQHQREERWRTQKALHLFSMVLGRMSELDPPKAVIYFADTMRREAGAHYLSFFARRAESSDGDTQFLQTFDASHAFDRVIEEATGMGIRVFTVEARGLMSAPNWALTSSTAAGTSSPVANTQSIRDAQNSLVGMAQETGGRSFLNGMRARKIAAQIQQDLSCIYLLSFDASHLKQNTSHRVVINVDRPGVKVHARGQISVQSESRRLTSRLMAAFASPEAAQSQFPVRGVVVPTGYVDGRYSALVQLRAPGSPLPASSWDLGLSLISRGEVAADTSGRVSVSGPGVPVVLETEMSFRPGPFKLVGVAHETTGNDVGTGEIENDWPDPDEAPVTLGPIAIL
jgi:VWFA-related protein